METLDNNTNALEAEVLNVAQEVGAEQEAIETQTETETETQETQETPFSGLSLDVKKQLINVNFREEQSGIFKITTSHKTNPLLYPDIVVAKATMTQILAFAANGINALLNDNSGSRKPERWAEIASYLQYGFLTKTEYVNSLPKSKTIKADAFIWVDELIILTINHTKELDAERKTKLISRLYSEDTATKTQAFGIAKAWIEVVATVKADYTQRLAEWRQEQEQAAINSLLDAIDTL